MQHKIYESALLDFILKFIFQRLLERHSVSQNFRLKMKKKKSSSTQCQRIFEDRGFNSGVSTSRGNNCKHKRDITLDIAIPNNNVYKGEDLFVDIIFRVLAKQIFLHCPFILERHVSRTYKSIYWCYGI